MTALRVAANRVIGFHYTLRDVSGELIDTSDGAGPLEYLHGHQSIIDGLERALEGKSIGDNIKVAIPPEHAYGPMEPDLIQSLPIKAFEAPDGLEAGMQFELEDGLGARRIFIIEEVNVDEDRVVVNGNHPLAGVELHFDVTLESVREATEQELVHGHVHVDGHDH